MTTDPYNFRELALRDIRQACTVANPDETPTLLGLFTDKRTADGQIIQSDFSKPIRNLPQHPRIEAEAIVGRIEGAMCRSVLDAEEMRASDIRAQLLEIRQNSQALKKAADPVRWYLAGCYRRADESPGRFAADILNERLFGRPNTPTRVNLNRAVDAALLNLQEVKPGRPITIKHFLAARLGALYLEYNDGFGRTVDQLFEHADGGRFADFVTEAVKNLNDFFKATGREEVSGVAVARLASDFRNRALQSEAEELQSEEAVSPNLTPLVKALGRALGISPE